MTATVLYYPISNPVRDDELRPSDILLPDEHLCANRRNPTLPIPRNRAYMAKALGRCRHLQSRYVIREAKVLHTGNVSISER